jgi:predicted ATPase
LVDLNSLNAIQLKALEQKIEEALQMLAEKNRERLEKLREEIFAFFAETGYGPADLFPSAPRIGRPRKTD